MSLTRIKDYIVRKIELRTDEKEREQERKEKIEYEIRIKKQKIRFREDSKNLRNKDLKNLDELKNLENKMVYHHVTNEFFHGFRTYLGIKENKHQFASLWSGGGIIDMSLPDIVIDQIPEEEMKVDKKGIYCFRREFETKREMYENTTKSPNYKSLLDIVVNSKMEHLDKWRNEK